MLPPHQRITRDRGCINRSTAHAQEHNSSPHSCRRHRYRQEHLPCRYEDMCGACNPALIAVPLILMSATQSWSQPQCKPTLALTKPHDEQDALHTWLRARLEECGDPPLDRLHAAKMVGSRVPMGFAMHGFPSGRAASGMCGRSSFVLSSATWVRSN